MVSLSEGRTTASICAPAVILEPLLPLPTPNAFRVLMESRHGSLQSRLLLTTGEERGNCLCGYYGDRKVDGVKRFGETRSNTSAPSGLLRIN